jgi:hypothetical protein
VLSLLRVQIQRGAIQNMLPAPGLLGAACEQLNDPFLNASDPAEDLDGSQRLAAYLHASNLGINQLTVRIPNAAVEQRPAHADCGTLPVGSSLQAKALAAYYDHDSTQGNGRSTQESYNATFRALFAYWQSRFSRFSDYLARSLGMVYPRWLTTAPLRIRHRAHALHRPLQPVDPPPVVLAAARQLGHRAGDP